ncbi:universal stress protein [Actinobaculum sp. 352]|uniref:universal stress protein n=1 Tax=Actinobaculum sp. 352 TaxID=2490946 RepID=UPI000F7E4736|nr:universal stress protein [Actinobaculum sp. 352]RTE48566.1 universal stress protein [Actinobaculum sp. 352]
MTIKRYNKILVGTDGSSLAGPTVARAATLADTENAELIIVCAYTTMTAREEATLSSVPAQSVKLGQVPGKASASQALDEAMSIAERQGAHVSAAILMDAEPAAALLETGKQFLVDAIVIGAIRDTSIVGRLLGTVASEVVRRAHCDVLVVRPAPGAPEPNVAEDVMIENDSTEE